MDSALRRTFFTTLTLAKTLEKEIAFERTLHAPVPFLKFYEQKYTAASADGLTGKLLRKDPHCTIEVDYLARAPLQRIEMNPEDLKPTEPTLQDIAGFVIGVHQEGQRSLYLDCTSVNSAVFIHHAAFSEKVSRPHKVFADSEYKVLFQVLSPSLQALITDWLVNLGVDEDIGKFCEIASLQRERELYVDWLQKVHTFVSHSLD